MAPLNYLLLKVVESGIRCRQRLRWSFQRKLSGGLKVDHEENLLLKVYWGWRDAKPYSSKKKIVEILSDFFFLVNT